MSERRLEMIQAHEPVAMIEGHADHVEAQVARSRSIVALDEPGGGHAANLALLARGDRLERRSGVRVDTAGLDLDEDDRRVVADDEVELPEAGAVVAGEQAVAETLEVLERKVLAEAAEVLAGVVGHGSDARRPSATRQHRIASILRRFSLVFTGVVALRNCW
jgi:electron transfer flavoprotein alpha subunit